jgi:hypothetical protein
MWRSAATSSLTIIILLIGVCVSGTLLGQTSFEPALDFSRTEFELGEAIVFTVGRAAAARVPYAALMDATCTVSITQPNGTQAAAKTFQGPGVYNGPILVQSLFHKELLNDLVALSPGVYRVAHSCGNQATVREITITPARLVDQLFLEASFPERIDVSGNQPLVVGISARNRGNTPLHVSKLAVANPVAVFAIPSYPATFRITPQTPAGQQPDQNSRTADIEAAATYALALTLENPLRNDSRYRISGNRIDGYQLNIVFVIPTSAESPAGVEGLYRFTACYDAAGQRVSTPCTPIGLVSYFP